MKGRKWRRRRRKALDEVGEKKEVKGITRRKRK